MDRRVLSCLLPVCLITAELSLPRWSFGASEKTTQETPQGSVQEAPVSAPAPQEVPEGTRFLIGLDTPLTSDAGQAGKHFRAHTLGPIVAPNGAVLPPGAEVRGHISRVEPAHVVGRARIWLTFDDIKTLAGRAPLVADVADVPGEHTVRTGDNEEGYIEERTSQSSRDAQAAAAGAAMGAIAGAKASGKRGAAIGAGMGAFTAFLISSGFGQEIQLQKDAKLELILERPLQVGKN
jgi:hypothetical protein